ncbi:arylsulfatase [Puniceicoccaceae bacterium K14]|nr:arylsulfatase [Puniceicoccaceae bacterium K14]
MEKIPFLNLGRFLGIIVLLLTTPLLQGSESSKAPNIIIIYTDDQGFGDSSAQNPDSKFQTPNIDRLAHEGIAFTNAHSPDAVCTPSRYGLLTGRYAWRTTLKNNVLHADVPCLIADGRMTIASMLRDNGYRTAMVGKWHLGMDIPGEFGNRDWTQPVKDMPLDKGFEYFYGIPASLNYGVLAWFEGRYAEVPPTLYTAKRPNDRHLDYRIEPSYQKTADEARELLERTPLEVAPDFEDNQCLTRFTNKAIEWIEDHTKSDENEKPFFLYLPYTSPHYPVCPLPEFWGQGDAGGYGEFMIETDYHVGQILEYLENMGLDDNTIIVYSSDNGAENSWKQRIEEFGHYSNYEYRGGKRDIYEGGHRVPFFVRWPNGIKNPGRSSDALVGQVDILATIAELIDVEIPENAGEDSQSFLTIMESAQKETKRVPLINHAFDGQMSITDGNWKLILPHSDKDIELYDLAKDPSEAENLADARPKKVKRLLQKATDIVVNGRSTPGVNQSNDTGYWDHLKWMDESEYEEKHSNVN